MVRRPLERPRSRSPPPDPGRMKPRSSVRRNAPRRSALGTDRAASCWFCRVARVPLEAPPDRHDQEHGGIPGAAGAGGGAARWAAERGDPIGDHLKAIDEATLVMDAASLAGNAGPALIVLGAVSGQPWLVAAGVGLVAVNGLAAALSAAEVGAAYRDDRISGREAITRGALLVGGVLPRISVLADALTTVADIARPAGEPRPDPIPAPRLSGDAFREFNQLQ